MNTTVIDNEDYMVLISAQDPAVLTNLQAQNAFGPVHKLNANMWLTRIAFDKANLVHDGLANGSYQLVVVRYTSESSFFSDDPALQSEGRRVTG